MADPSSSVGPDWSRLLERLVQVGRRSSDSRIPVRLGTIRSRPDPPEARESRRTPVCLGETTCGSLRWNGCSGTSVSRRADGMLRTFDLYGRCSRSFARSDPSPTARWLTSSRTCKNWACQSMTASSDTLNASAASLGVRSPSSSANITRHFRSTAMSMGSSFGSASGITAAPPTRRRSNGSPC